MTLKSKKALVTGVTRGIGKAIGRAFRDRGAWVAGTGTGTQPSQHEECDEYFAADFSRREDIDACSEFVRRVEPDILVNNAGINILAPFLDIEPEDFLRIHQVNVYAPFVLCKAALSSMKRKGWGRIVSLSSIWGKISKEQRASYSASKFAIDGMTLALAIEHASDGILANSVAPGFTDTELTRRVLGSEQMSRLAASVPARRMARPEEIAELVVWLASPANTYVTGQNIAIDGGFSRA